MSRFGAFCASVMIKRLFLYKKKRKRKKAVVMTTTPWDQRPTGRSLQYFRLQYRMLSVHLAVLQVEMTVCGLFSYRASGFSAVSGVCCVFFGLVLLQAVWLFSCRRCRLCLLVPARLLWNSHEQHLICKNAINYRAIDKSPSTPYLI